MKRKNIIIGMVLLSMLFLAACGEEKPLADRVIENLEDCMGAREVTEEEYAEIKEKTGLFFAEYRSNARTENAYLRYKKDDLENISNEWSFILDEDIAIIDSLIYKYENVIDGENSFLEVDICEFSTLENATKCRKDIEMICDNWRSEIMFDESWNVYSKERMIGVVKGGNYIYQVVDYATDRGYIEEIYLLWINNQVLRVHYSGHKEHNLYKQYKKYLKKMKFEGLNDIKLEYVEPQSGDA